jgi:hypothetical protein
MRMVLVVGERQNSLQKGEWAHPTHYRDTQLLSGAGGSRGGESPREARGVKEA